MAISPGGPESWYHNVSILDSTGAKSDAGGGNNWSYKMCKLQSNRDHRQTNTQLVYRPDALPVANQQCNVKALKGNLAEFLRK